MNLVGCIAPAHWIVTGALGITGVLAQPQPASPQPTPTSPQPASPQPQPTPASPQPTPASPQPASPQPMPASPPSDGAGAPPRGRQRRQGYLRLAGEYSRFAYQRSDVASFEVEGAATLLPLKSPVERRAWGGRFEGGLAFVLSPHFTVVPHGSLSIAHLEARREHEELVGVRQSWDSSPWYGTLATGAELQFLHRILGWGLESGFGVLHDPLTGTEPPEMEIRQGPTVGLLARTTASLRFPIASGLALGGAASAEAWIGLNLVNRTMFGAFVEFCDSTSDQEQATP